MPQGATVETTTRLSATELARSLSDVLGRVRFRGERFVVERNGEPIATIAPLGHAPSVTLRDLASRLSESPLMDGDFADDLEALQRNQMVTGEPSWPS